MNEEREEIDADELEMIATLTTQGLVVDLLTPDRDVVFSGEIPFARMVQMAHTILLEESLVTKIEDIN